MSTEDDDKALALAELGEVEEKLRRVRQMAMVAAWSYVCNGTLVGGHSPQEMVCVRRWETATGRRRESWLCPACGDAISLNLEAGSETGR